MHATTQTSTPTPETAFDFITSGGAVSVEPHPGNMGQRFWLEADETANGRPCVSVWRDGAVKVQRYYSANALSRDLRARKGSTVDFWDESRRAARFNAPLA